MSATDLKPCPFCGKPAELTENEYSAPMVACEWCLARTCSHSDSLAIDKWNRRPGEDALHARAETWEATANTWRAFAVDVAGVTGACDPDDVGIEDLRGLAGAVERLRARAEAAEAALATARAEGAAAERAAVVKWVRGQISTAAIAGDFDLLWAAGAVEAGAHVRPVEGA
jgi:hypothetical protein